MIIDCISDLHGHYPKLEGGDLLIVAGDWTARDTEPECFQFFDWIHKQKYRKKIVIAGNHDNLAQKENYKGPAGVVKDSFTYLCDSGTEFEGLKVWGSPWTKRFPGMNPHCMAFTVDTDEELAEKWALIPDDVDVLVTHCPPYGYFDHVNNTPVGSNSLLTWIKKIKPKLYVFGHIHEGGGLKTRLIYCNDDHIITNIVNASHVNEYYKPVNKPIRIELDA